MFTYYICMQRCFQSIYSNTCVKFCRGSQHQNCQFPRVSNIVHSMCTSSGQVCEMNCVQGTVHSSFHKLVHWLYTWSAQYWTLLGTGSFGGAVGLHFSAFHYIGTHLYSLYQLFFASLHYCKKYYRKRNTIIYNNIPQIIYNKYIYILHT